MKKWLIGGAAGFIGLLATPIAMMLLVVLLLGNNSGPGHSSSGISDLARQDICGGAQTCPALEAYLAAAKLCPGLDWSVLAGIGKVESDHGRSNVPGVHSGANSAGAMGPMQFLADTWARWGKGDIYNLADAAAAAARYLCSMGAGNPATLRQAIYGYNHLWSYVDEVLGWAAKYAAAPSATSGGGAGIGQKGNPFVGCPNPVVTQPYGPTSLVGEPIINGVRFHTGIDLSCPAGTPIRSLTSGTAHFVPVSASGGFGNRVVIDSVFGGPSLPEGHYFVSYNHMLDSFGPDGVTVNVGDIVGREGSTGFSTGPHLHFEVDINAPRVTNSVNPAPLLAL